MSAHGYEALVFVATLIARCCRLSWQILKVERRLKALEEYVKK